MGGSCMIASIRTPDWKWDSMDADERLIEAIDQSGVLGVLSQLKGIADQPERMIGAGPNVVMNLTGGLVQGDINQFSWGLPYRNYLLTKGLFDSAIDNIERAGQ